MSQWFGHCSYSVWGEVHGEVPLYVVQVGKLETGQPVFSSCSIVLIADSGRDTQEVVLSTLERGHEGGSVCSGEGGEEGGVRVLCGSHDRCVYCWKAGEGERLWRTPLDSEIYATPFPFNLPTPSQTRAPPPVISVRTSTNTLQDQNNSRKSALASCVCACSTSGTVYLLDLHTGKQLVSLTLPGEIFSSPVVVDGCILVGCRDDCIYCIDVTHVA